MNEKSYKNLVFLADGDLKTAEDKLNTKDPFTATICFHSQQCVEKYLKAYLSFIGKPFRKPHDIAELIELCKEEDEDFEILYELKAYTLTKYAVEVRYPDEFYIPSFEEAKRSIEIARNVKNFVLKKINIVPKDTL